MFRSRTMSMEKVLFAKESMWETMNYLAQTEWIMMYQSESNHEIHAQKIPDFFIKEKENYQKLLDTQYVLLPHRGTFLMPYVHNSLPHKEIYGGYDSILKNNVDF